MEQYEHLQREKNIKKEFNRLKNLYKKFTPDKMPAIEELIKNAAFMKVMLEEFRETLIKHGTTEVFKQGKQEIVVERHESKQYLPYIQKYTQIMKQLIDLLPPSEAKKQEDELTKFVNRKKDRKKELKNNDIH